MRRLQRFLYTTCLVIGHREHVVGRRCRTLDECEPFFEGQNGLIEFFENRVELAHLEECLQLISGLERVFSDTLFEISKRLLVIAVLNRKATESLKNPSSTVGLGSLQVDVPKNFFGV